jgi:hypothetical protein
MRQRTRSALFLRNRKARRERVLRRMAAMRAAKDRKRLANPVEREPRMQPFHPLELGLRDTRSGEVAWVPFRSVRDSAQAAGTSTGWSCR